MGWFLSALSKPRRVPSGRPPIPWAWLTETTAIRITTARSPTDESLLMVKSLFIAFLPLMLHLLGWPREVRDSELYLVPPEQRAEREHSSTPGRLPEDQGSTARRPPCSRRRTLRDRRGATTCLHAEGHGHEMTWAICHMFPNGSRTIARRSPYGVSRGSSSDTAPPARACRYTASAS